MSLIINFIPVLTVSTSMVKAMFTGGKDLGKNGFSPLALAGLVARIPGLIQASQIQFLGRELRSLHITTCC